MEDAQYKIIGMYDWNIGVFFNFFYYYLREINQKKVKFNQNYQIKFAISFDTNNLYFDISHDKLYRYLSILKWQ